MFTGIVEETGTVRDVTVTDDGRRLRVSRPAAFDDLQEGQSVAVAGVCLTVERYDDDAFETFLAAETVEKTYLGDVGVGDELNLERALRADGRLDGHVVQGHVDTTTEVTAIDRVGEDWRFEFALPADVARYVVSKGSVALDGISLTVADRGEDRFAVAIVPTTYEVTTLSEKAVGDPVHVEVDVVAKYVESMLSGYAEADAPVPGAE
jgi:riboflavin synthase